MSAGRAIGSTTDQNTRKVPAPSIRACSSTLTGIDSKKFFMMKTPAASTSSGRIMPGVRVVHAELVDDEELRDEQHHAGTAMTAMRPAKITLRPRKCSRGERVAGERVEEHPAERDEDGDDRRSS